MVFCGRIFYEQSKKAALFINEQISAVRIQTQSTIRLSAVAHFPHMILLYSGGQRFAGKSTTVVSPVHWMLRAESGRPQTERLRIPAL